MRKYKKLLVLLFCVLVLLNALLGCNNIEISERNNTTGLTNHTKTTEIPENAAVLTKASIFEGEISNYNTDKLKLIDIKTNNNTWIINGKEYIQQEDKYPLISMTSKWKVNLNEFSPFGISEDSSIVFAQNSMSNDNVLVAKNHNKYFLLVASDGVLNPHNYSIDDFYYSSSQLNFDSQQIASLWKTHINTNEDNYVVFLDGNPSTITLSLKESTGLIYEFDYIRNGDKFYTSLPWKSGETSHEENTEDSSLS